MNGGTIPYRIISLAPSLDESEHQPTVHEVDEALRHAGSGNHAAHIWALRLDDPSETPEPIQLHLEIKRAYYDMGRYEVRDQFGRLAIIWLPDNPLSLVDFDLIT